MSDSRFTAATKSTRSKEEIAAYQRAYRQKHKQKLSEYDKERKKRLRAENPEAYLASERERHLKHKYGISASDWRQLFDSQGGVCAICRLPSATTKPLHVDHDHVTGRVRGLLCYVCNFFLGKVDNIPAVLDRIAVYRRGNV